MNKIKVLKRVAYRKTRSIEEAEEIVQNVMEALCKKALKKDKVQDLEKYIYIILKYKSIDNYRKNSKIQCCSDEILENYFVSENVDITEKINLYNALQSLDKIGRSMIVYKYFYGYKNIEIARIMGCSDKTVSRKIDKSLKIMKEKILPTKFY